MKSYTDLEQSKKLAEFLPLESADMFYTSLNRDYPWIWIDRHLMEVDDIPCWSLAALLDGLSKWAEGVNEAGIVELSYEKGTKWSVSILNCGKIKDCYADNQIDACVKMIISLNELNLL